MDTPPTPQPPDPPPVQPPTAPPVPAAPRPLLVRLFGISVWGGIKLAGLCVLVGFFVMAASFDPRHPDFNVGQALGNMLGQAFSALGWMIRNFWQPALAGALVVLPAWVIWRVVSLPFRK
ncbi:MAG: hypothetical protein ACK4MQ_11630 [Hyphomonas sp.]